MGSPRKDQTETAQENRGTKRKVEESQKVQPKKVKPQVQPKKMKPQKPEVEEPRLIKQQPKAANDKTAEMEQPNKQDQRKVETKNPTEKARSQTLQTMQGKKEQLTAKVGAEKGVPLKQKRAKQLAGTTVKAEPKKPHPRQKEAKKATKKQVSQTDVKQQQRSIEKESEKHIEQSVRAEPGLPKQLAQVANDKTTEKKKSRKQDHRKNDEVNKLMEKAELTAKKRLKSPDNPWKGEWQQRQEGQQHDGREWWGNVWKDKQPQLPQPQVYKTMEAATAVHLHAQAEDQRKAAEAKQEAEQAQRRAEAKQDLREAAAEADEAARQASEEAEEEERWRTLARNEVKAQMAPFQEKRKAELAEAEEKKKEAAAKEAQAAREVKQKDNQGQKGKGVIVPRPPRSPGSRANLERREGEKIKHLFQQQMCLQAEAWAAVEIATEKHLQLKNMFADSISRDKENMVLRKEVRLLEASKQDWL